MHLNSKLKDQRMKSTEGKVSGRKTPMYNHKKEKTLKSIWTLQTYLLKQDPATMRVITFKHDHSLFALKGYSFRKITF